MAHFKQYFDSQFAGVWDLGGHDRIVTIARVQGGEVGGHQGRQKSKKLILHVRELDKPLVCNVTNAKAIAGMYGPDVSAWPGKRITLYPTTTAFGGESVDCIRVRPTPPRGEPERIEGRPVDREVRDRQERAARNAERQLEAHRDAFDEGDGEPPPARRRQGEHPAAPIRDATTPQELEAAIRTCAAWILEDHGARWPRVLSRAEQLGMPAEEAEMVLDLAREAAAGASAESGEAAQ